MAVDKDNDRPKGPGFSRADWARIWSNIRWSLAYCWPEQRTLILSLIANAVVRSLLPAAAALALRGLVNQVTWFVTDQGGDPRLLSFWFAVGLVTAIATAVTNSVQQLLKVNLTEDLGFRVQLDILNHVATLDYATFEEPGFRNKLLRAQRASANSLSGFIVTVIDIGSNLAQAVSLLFLLVAIEPLIVFLVPLLGIPYFLYQMSISRRYFLEEYDRATNRRWIGYYQGQMSNPDAAAESRLLDLAPLFIERSRQIMGHFREGNMAHQRRIFFAGLLFAITSTLGVYIALGAVIRQIIDGGLTIGDLAIFGGAAMRLRGIVEAVISQSGQIRWQMLNVDVLRELYAVLPEPRLIETTDLSGAAGDFEFRGVSFAYPGSRDSVLRDISLYVQPGETVALVGENGAGKTTLAKLLAGLYRPDDGTILIGGRDLQTIDPDCLRRHMAFVFQFFGRYEATATENIAFGDRQRLLDDSQAVRDLAHEVGLDELIKRMPEGYDTILGRMFGHYSLSGGQWQYFAIARALARDAKILILDEPTANLDVQTEYELFGRFKELAQGRTTVLISHRFSTVKIADRIIVLDNGRIVEGGSHDELMAQGGKYAALYNIHRRHLLRDEP